MSAKNFVRDLLLNAFRRENKPIRKRPRVIGRQIEQLEDRLTPSTAW